MRAVTVTMSHLSRSSCCCCRSSSCRSWLHSFNTSWWLTRALAASSSAVRRASLSRSSSARARSRSVVSTTCKHRPHPREPPSSSVPRCLPSPGLQRTFRGISHPQQTAKILWVTIFQFTFTFWVTVCKWFALCYRTVVLSVCNIGVLRPNGWMDELGTKVGLGPGHTVLDRDPAPPKGAQKPPIFQPVSVVAKCSHISAPPELL